MTGTFDQIFEDLLVHGEEVKPRNLRVLELEDYACDFQPGERFMNYPSRKLSLKYIKSELLWYLRGNKADLSILEHAKMWRDLVQPDGTINSNYGAALWGPPAIRGGVNQFDRARKELELDRDSRRASMTILQPQHLLTDQVDVPCTYAVNFRIRRGYLHMSVHMRSQDAIFGLGNDAPFFSFVHELMLNLLRKTYPDLKWGNYHHAVDSLHVYERHFEMLQKLVDEPNESVACPLIKDWTEAWWLRSEALHYALGPSDYEFSTWLTEDA